MSHRRPDAEQQTEPEPSSDGFRWVSLESDQSSSWPLLQPASAIALLAVIFITLAFAFSGGASAAASFTASNVDITSNGGQVTSLTVAPTGDITYDGLEAEPNGIDVKIQVKKSGGTGTWETIGTKTISATGQQGTASFTFSQLNVLSASSLTQGDFKAATDGGSTSTTLDIRVVATLNGVKDSGGDLTARASTSYDVNVNNQAATGGVGGKANTGGN